MRYTKTYWRHQEKQNPILYISAFDITNQEIYRVEVFADGRQLYADQTNTPDDNCYIYGITLQEVLMFDDPKAELFSIEISEQEFNEYWQKADNPKYLK
ncbi:MAG: DUF6881 domain-containing protein [Moraxella sp.]